MSFVKNDNQQLTLLDSTFNLTEDRIISYEAR